MKKWSVEWHEWYAGLTPILSYKVNLFTLIKMVTTETLWGFPRQTDKNWLRSRLMGISQGNPLLRSFRFTVEIFVSSLYHLPENAEKYEG